MSASDKVALTRWLHGVLVAEQRKRDDRKLWVEGRGPEWVLAEREAMWRAVDGELRVRGREPVALETIERLENMAAGHSDYTAKFALHCAEIVVGERDSDGLPMAMEQRR